ncbi:MAG: anhydro-N-acetylmuramic acid kinase, partial [Gammaproteobacteria bacterium]|nr:anhydro-N-acetylmuramic acid kinase [Gammaproteobacteria bacterium]
MHNLYIGLMSGTSMDAVDAAVVDFAGEQPRIIASLARPITEELRSLLMGLCSPGNDEIARVYAADYHVGEWFADATLALLKSADLRARDVRAIGSHGQTVRHDPRAPHPYSLQIGNPYVLRERTGITVVSDFRRADMAAGGQGAPLVPGFHHAIFAHLNHTRVIVNIGGMANITVLVPGAPVIG